MKRKLLAFFLILSISVLKAQNYGIELTGAASGASVVSIPALNIAALPVTFEAWFKPNGAQNDYASIWFTRGTGNEISGMFIRNNPAQNLNNEFRSVWQNTLSTTTTPLIVTNNVWHHCAIVITSTSRTLYLDGTAFSYTGTPVNTPFSVTSYLGYDNAVSTRTFKGTIDEVRIWSTARTAQQLADNKYSTLVGNEAGLKGYWNFNDQNATRATDLTTGVKHGTLIGVSYVASNYAAYDCSQTSTEIIKNSSNNVVLRLKVDKTNLSQAYQMNSIAFNTTGTTNTADISGASVYYTGSSSTFNSTQLYGTTSATPLTNFTITGNQALSNGENYFWLVYNVGNSAVNGNLLDAQCTSFTMTGATSETKTPTTSAPAGALTINNDLQIPFVKLPIQTVTSDASTLSGSPNFVSFQQDAITTFNGYQYVTYWNSVGHVCIARKKMPLGSWEILEFTDYTIVLSRLSDNHYNISMGICPNDGTIHIAYDHHNDPLHYRKSIVGMATDPEGHPWTMASFGSTLNYLVAGNVLSDVTYPRFEIKPDGNLLYEYRIGISGGGDSYIYHYTASTGLWTNKGMYVKGSNLVPDENAYINGMHYDKNGRLHVSWVWRETPTASTNHDVYYAYSDDDGLTWKNSTGTVIATNNTSPMTIGTTGIKILTIPQQRGLINQESQTVDSKGHIHILQSYMVNAEANTTDWAGSRAKSHLRHIYQDDAGTWHNDDLGVGHTNRSQIAVDENDNLYVVCPNYRIYFASSANNWATWNAMDLSESTSAINEGLIDREQLLNESVLSFCFAQTGGKVIVPYYLLEKQKVDTGTGLREAFYNDQAFNYLMYQDNNNLNYNWADAAPNSYVNPNNFSIQWDGSIETKYAEVYILYFTTSGATRVWINDVLVVDALSNSTSNEFIVPLSLIPSHKYKIKIQSSYGTQAASFKMEWSSLQQVRQVIPKTALYSIANQTVPSSYNFSIDLTTGWNIVAMNFTPTNNTVATVFPNATIVKSADAFYSTLPSSRTNTLSIIEGGKAYLVKNTSTQTLTIAGKSFVLTNPISLTKGLNLLAYPYYCTSTITSFTNGISSKIIKIKNLTDSYVPGSGSNTLLNFDKNKGFYIDVNENCSLTW